MELNTRENPDSKLYHFSRKVVVLSVMFFGVNLGLYLMILFGQVPAGIQKVSSQAVFAQGQEVFVKSPYDEGFLQARPGQDLFAGMSLRTGGESYAEIRLDGNVVRLDQNTEIQVDDSEFNGISGARLMIRLVEGSVWVNAFDPIGVRTPRAMAVFRQDVGVYTYKGSVNRVMSISKSAELSLVDGDGKMLSKVVVPLKSQATFVDAQVIPEYSRLEYSKLKKELKMGPVSEAVLADGWIKRNTADDLRVYLAENHYLFSKGAYKFEDWYWSVREKASWFKAQKEEAQLARVKILIKYLLGDVQDRGDVAEAKGLIVKFDTLASTIKGMPELERALSRQFYAIQNAKPETVAGLVREKLRMELYPSEGPELLRTYLSDVDFLLRVLMVDKASKVAEAWLAKWDEGMVRRFPREFDTQSRVYHSVMLANADRIGGPLLAVLEKAEDARLANASNRADSLYEIALERLDIGKYLVAAKRYSEAKNYLRTSYSKLNLGSEGSSSLVREIFMKDTTLLADRIAFAEQSMHASAGAMDEGTFASYLSIQERDKTLEERFGAFLEGAKVAEIKKEPPQRSEVVRRFAASRITVAESDLAQKEGYPFEFEVKNARLADRAIDGSGLSFEAIYESNANAVSSIVMNGKPMNGNFALDDLVRIAISGETVGQPSDKGSENPVDNGAFKGLVSNEEIQRSQAVAQDLAIRLMINELKEAGIVIGSTNQVRVTDMDKLARFQVTRAILTDSASKRNVVLDFGYDSGSKTLSGIVLEKLFAELPSEVPANQLSKVVFDVIYGMEQQTKSMQSIVSELATMGWVLDGKEARFTDAALNRVEIKTLKMKQMPIVISGEYDRLTRRFVRAQNPLLTKEDVDPKDYAETISKMVVVDTLGKRGIAITEANLAGALPAEKVRIVDYARGSKGIDFTYDIVNNRLVDISLRGSDAKVASMTFEEFALIQGGEAPTSAVPVIPSSGIVSPAIPATPSVEIFTPAQTAPPTAPSAPSF